MTIFNFSPESGRPSNPSKIEFNLGSGLYKKLNQLINPVYLDSLGAGISGHGLGTSQTQIMADIKGEEVTISRSLNFAEGFLLQIQIPSDIYLDGDKLMDPNFDLLQALKEHFNGMANPPDINIMLDSVKEGSTPEEGKTAIREVISIDPSMRQFKGYTYGEIDKRDGELKKSGSIKYSIVNSDTIIHQDIPYSINDLANRKVFLQVQDAMYGNIDEFIKRAHKFISRN